MLWVQLDAIGVNILIELMFDTQMVSGGGLWSCMDWLNRYNFA